MSSITLTRRNVISTAALALATSTWTSRAGAQTPVLESDQSVTTELFGKEVSWAEPWTRDESVAAVLETDYKDDRIDGVVGRLYYDVLVLQHPNGAIAEVFFVPDPGVGRSWDIPFQLRAQEADTALETGSTEDVWYFGVRFFIANGVEYGRLATFTDPAEGPTVEVLALTAPASEFGRSLEDYQHSVSIDGEQPFSGIDPVAVQALLDAQTSGHGSPEATPAT